MYYARMQIEKCTHVIVQQSVLKASNLMEGQSYQVKTVLKQYDSSKKLSYHSKTVLEIH